MTNGEFLFNTIDLGPKYAVETCWVLSCAGWVPLIEGFSTKMWPMGSLGDWARPFTYASA